MMRVSISIVVLFFLYQISSSAQWAESNSGMGYQVIGALLADGDTLYACSTFDVFKSTNEGDNWFKINTGLPVVSNFYAIAQSGNFLIAGGDSPGIWLSSNNGVGWFRTTSGVDSNDYVYSFFVDGNNVYAGMGSPSAVGISTDNGNTWTKHTNGIASSQLITGVTKLGSTLYATHSALGLYVSTDNGVTWTLPLTGIGAQDKNAIVTSGSNLCVAATNGVWTSTDNGVNWDHSLTTGFISGFGDDGTSLYAVGSLPPYRSTDNGVSWNPVDDNGLVSSINNTIQFTTQYALINTFGIGVYRRNLSEITAVEQDRPESSPEYFHLAQNYPNPFNPSTRIQYQVSRNSQVSLKIYDMFGNKVATLVNEYKPSGNYEVDFKAINLASGVYLYKLQAGNFIETKKLMLLK
jgi:photosystem II stability/assembly factor-like uncharacterized protein